jgi:hypothetical protein
MLKAGMRRSVEDDLNFLTTLFYNSMVENIYVYLTLVYQLSVTNQQSKHFNSTL